MENNNTNGRTSNNAKQKKKKVKYKASRILIVVIAAILALFLIVSGVKFVLGLFSGEKNQVDPNSANTEQIKLAKSIIGENIIYVQATFEDSDGVKYKGMAFLSETDLLFIGDNDYEKKFNREFIQEISLTTGSTEYEFAITDENGSIYSFSGIVKDENSEGFMVILER